MKPISALPPYLAMIHINILPSTIRSLSGLFPSRFTTKTFSILFSQMRATCRTHLLLLDLIILKTFYAEEPYRLWSFSLCNSLHSITLTRCSSLSPSDQVSHPKIHHEQTFWGELIAYFPWYDTGRIENDASNNSSIVACVFVTAVRFLPSRCLATIGEFLPSHCLATIRGFTYRHTDWWKGFFNQAVEVGPVGLIYVPSFIKIGLGIQKLTWWMHRRQTDLISLLYFVKIRKLS
jgi:hypothetical protein